MSAPDMFLCDDPGKQARRVEQAAMLEATQVPDDLVAVMCKIAARGKILTDDLVAIERAGITLGVEVAMPERDGRYQGDDGEWLVVVLNLTPVVRHGYRIGVPVGGHYQEVLNTDAAIYGGSGVGNGSCTAEEQPWMNRPCSLSLTLPPLAAIVLAPEA